MDRLNRLLQEIVNPGRSRRVTVGLNGRSRHRDERLDTMAVKEQSMVSKGGAWGIR